MKKIKKFQKRTKKKFLVKLQNTLYFSLKRQLAGKSLNSVDAVYLL